MMPGPAKKSKPWYKFTMNDNKSETYHVRDAIANGITAETMASVLIGTVVSIEPKPLPLDGYDVSGDYDF